MKNNILQLRKELGVTLKQLSQITNIPCEDLKSVENDELEPTLIDAHKITKALGKEFIAEVFPFK